MGARLAVFRCVSPTEQAQRFLSSELHAAVAGGDVVEPVIECNLASADHVERVRESVRRAVPLLYGSIALPMLLAVLLIAGLAFLGVAFKGNALFPTMVAGEQAFWIALAGLIVWPWAELRMQLRLRSRLGAALAARISDRRKKQQSRHRWIVRLGMVGGWLGVLWMSLRP